MRLDSVPSLLSISETSQALRPQEGPLLALVDARFISGSLLCDVRAEAMAVLTVAFLRCSRADARARQLYLGGPVSGAATPGGYPPARENVCTVSCAIIAGPA